MQVILNHSMLIGIVSLVLTTHSLSAQPVREIPPGVQTVEGTTLSISKAGFYHEHEFRLHSFGGRMGEPSRKGFMLGYEVRPPLQAVPEQTAKFKALAPPDSSTSANVLGGNIKDLRLFAPTGELLYPRMISRSNNGGNQKWDDVAPHWEHVKADFEWMLPGAPKGADGKFEEMLEFKKVPLPTKFEEPVKIEQLLITANGTEIMLEKVAARAVKDAEGGVNGKLDITVSWTWSTEVPDAFVELDLNKVVDGTGKVMQLGGSSSCQRETYTFIGSELPPKSARTMDVTIKVQEDAPSLKLPQWFKHSLFELKLPALNDLIAKNTINTSTPQALKDQTHSVAVNGVTADLEPDYASNYQFQGRLWLRDTQAQTPQSGASTEPPRKWFVKDIVGQDQAGNELKSGWEVFTSDHLFWKAGDIPAARHERDQPFHIHFRDGRKPKKLTIKALVEPARHLHQVFNFTGVPVPKPGQTQAVNQTVKSASGGQAILRQVTYFTNPGALPGLDIEKREKLQPARGLALVLETLPTLGEKAQQHLKFGRAGDDRGRALNDNRYITTSEGNILLKTPAQPHLWTVYLLPPAADATSLQVQIVTDEILFSGQPQTITFKDVPMPASMPMMW